MQGFTVIIALYVPKHLPPPPPPQKKKKEKEKKKRKENTTRSVTEYVSVHTLKLPNKLTLEM